MFAKLRKNWWRRLKLGWLKFEDVPRLNFYKTRLDDVIDSAMFDILLILIFNIIFFMLSFLFFLKYDPK